MLALVSVLVLVLYLLVLVLMVVLGKPYVEPATIRKVTLEERL